MKQSDISYDEKLNEVRLMITHPNNTGYNYVLLEGKADILLFRKLFNEKKCKIERIPGGNKKVENAVETLMSFSPLVFGIRDADFIRIIDTTYSKTNIFLTDCHDIEMTMLSFNSVLAPLFYEHTQLTENQFMGKINQLISIIRQIGILKLVSESEKLELRFDCGFQDLISFRDYSFNFSAFFDRVISNSPKSNVMDLNELRAKILQLESDEHDMFQLTNGHDLTKTIATYLRECHKVNIGFAEVEKSLRLIFRTEHFMQTRLCCELNIWQIANSTQLF